MSTRTARIQWSPEKIEELRQLYPVKTDSELEQHFGASIGAIRGVTHRHDIRRRERRSSQDTWTPERIQFLTDNIGTQSYGELAGHLGLSSWSVRVKAQKLGLHQPGRRGRPARTPDVVCSEVPLSEEERRRAMELGVDGAGQRRWTDERRAAFREAYPTTPTGEMAERFGLSEKSVVETASRLKVRKAR